MNETNRNDRWQPTVGEETVELLATSSAPASAHDSIIQSSRSILSRCPDPQNADRSETGLVVGYVQSGKTLSFTTVAALAHDNCYPLVIVIAGTSMPLWTQSTNRFRRDLRLDSREDRAWLLLQNPRNEPASVDAINGVIEEWRDPEVPTADKQTVLISVMKHHSWLQKLQTLLAQLELSGVPALIIDDEADQASMNTRVNLEEESTTYQRLMELRATLPHHAFLQYTATPQAPLLINIIDALSPNFVHVLTPGDGYTGGREFFIDGIERYVRQIPHNEVPTRDEPLTEPPDSLIESLAIFMVGVAAHLAVHGNRGNRSMMVHPSRTTDPHAEYANWVRVTMDRWQADLQLPDHDPDRQDTLADFRAAHDELAPTVDDMPSFEDVAGHLRRAFRVTSVIEVNSKQAGNKTPQIDWKHSLGRILVGGQAMDRGYTVEGLTVTYMPRGLGVGNADTVQQRGRFFGYKRSYIGYCRIYLEQEVSYAFHDYVEHEEDIRAQLSDYDNSDLSLDEWKRAFILSPDLRPTRSNVLDLDYMRGGFSQKWFQPRYLAAPSDVISANRLTVERFLQHREFEDYPAHHDNSAATRHRRITDLPLDEVLENLLIPYRMIHPNDSQNYTGLLLQLSRALDQHPDEVCTLILMGPHDGGELRSRKVNDHGRLVANLFQGANPSRGPKKGERYPGDSAIGSGDSVAIQVHRLDLIHQKEKHKVREDIAVPAVWVPRRMGRNWLVQE